MDKIRVLFPEVEAGLGHIMPMRAIKELFESRYSKYCEVISVNFLKDSNDPALLEYNEFLINSVKQYNLHPKLGYYYTFICEFFGSRLSSYGTITLRKLGSKEAGVKYMEELNPDVVFSTHWCTNYYAEHLKKKPFTVSYCPDAVMNALFRYKADLAMISMPKGYQLGLKKKKRFNKDNLKLVPFLIRNQAFNISTDKIVNRKNLNLPLDKFTIILVEGGYGIGKMRKIVELLAESDLNITLIPICGKNEELYQHLKSLKTSKSVSLMPIHFTDRILEYIAASDLYCGKSGNGIAEPTFFGVPSIITNYATIIEKNIGEHYINVVGSARKEFDPEEVCNIVKDYINNPDHMKQYIDSALKYHDNYGASVACDLLFEAIKNKFNIKVD